MLVINIIATVAIALVGVALGLAILASRKDGKSILGVLYFCEVAQILALIAIWL